MGDPERTTERSKKQRREPWPPPAPISHEGKVAGLTATICLAVVGAAYSYAAIRATMCVGFCVVNRGLAGLLTLAVVPATLAAVASIRSVSRRPVAATGDARWRFGLGAIFAIGVAAAASRIPDLTCPTGYALGGDLCARVGNAARLDAANWVWLKDALIAGGIVLGATVIRARSLIPSTAVVAAIVWVGGTGFLLVSTLWR
jgi:hypothetical protein